MKEALTTAEVEVYKQEKIIFLKNRVGVITHGSVRIRSHQNGILVPYTVGKYKVGQILGHGDSDNGLTTHAQTWFTAFDDDTEIVYFSKAKFDRLWNMQLLNQEHTMLAQLLSNNRMF